MKKKIFTEGVHHRHHQNRIEVDGILFRNQIKTKCKKKKKINKNRFNKQNK